MYSRFQINISFGNDAMCDPEDVADALVTVESRVRAGQVEGRVLDANGNSVGDWAFKTEHEDNDE